MRPIKSLAASAATALFLAAGSASAATVSECLEDIAAVRAAIEMATTFVNPETDQASLLRKADSASSKLNKLKVTDSLENLGSIAFKVNELLAASKPKIGPDDASAILAENDIARTCVTQLLTQ